MNLSNRKKDFVVMNELQKFCVFLSQFDLTETKCRQIVDSLDDVYPDLRLGVDYDE